jgi:hypothetical protein
MKCRYCEYIARGIADMRSHLNKNHKSEYMEIIGYLSEQNRIIGEKQRASRWLRNGKSFPQTNWGVLGQRL